MKEKPFVFDDMFCDMIRRKLLQYHPLQRRQLSDRRQLQTLNASGPVRTALQRLRVLAIIGPTATTRLAKGAHSFIRVSPVISTTPSATVR